MKKQGKSKEIILIATVIIIVVLTILAIISISKMIKDNDDVRKEENQTQVNTEISNKENISNEETSNNLDEQISTKPEIEIAIQNAKSNEMLNKTENTELKLEDGTVWIPAGFKIHRESGKTVNEGIVITDANENEFVWVPVSEDSFNNMFIVSNNNYLLCGDTEVKTNYYSNLRLQIGKEKVKSNKFNLTTPGTTLGTTSIREPDLVTIYDNNTNANKAGFSSVNEMAQEFVDDYKKMKESIEKYKGFYIGRYELTGTVSNPTVKPGTVLSARSAENWYNLYRACRNVKKGNAYVTSTMIWGCQWDETMNWITNTQFDGNAALVEEDSTSWGNYFSSNVLASNGTTVIKEANKRYKLDTGITTYTMVNKIYDLAGNCSEWTQEAISSFSRVMRGGIYISDNEIDAAMVRSGQGTEMQDEYISTRVTLYINI